MKGRDARLRWIDKLCNRLEKSGIAFQRQSVSPGVATLLRVDGADWIRAVAHCGAKACRLASLWGDGDTPHWWITACFEKQGVYLWLRCELSETAPAVPSMADYFPGAARLERHCRDLLGIEFSDVADKRRWTRHQAWSEDTYPLRPDCPAGAVRQSDVPADSDYPMQTVTGEAVCEIPVGPIHAGIIEPGHFRFHAIGETVLALEARLGYTHKGVERLAAGRTPTSLLRLAARISGDTAVGHAWATCRALEYAFAVEAPPRAQWLRGILAERERVANHLGDIGAIYNDIGFSFAHMQFGRLREGWLRRNHALFGHRLLMDTLVPGGVAVDLDRAGSETLLGDLDELGAQLDGLEPIFANSQSVRGRTVTTGVLTSEQARRLGCLGYVGRASGVGFDARVDAAYPPYDTVGVQRVCYEQGDVQARIQQRFDEIKVSLALLRQMADKLTPGPLHAHWPRAPAAAEGFGWVEGWRGEILTCLRLYPDGTVARYFPRDPSWFNWPALEQLIHGNIVPDFPVCNKSVNASYSGQDL